MNESSIVPGFQVTRDSLYRLRELENTILPSQCGFFTIIDLDTSFSINSVPVCDLWSGKSKLARVRCMHPVRACTSEGGEPTYGGKACLVDAFHVAIESQQKRRFPAEIFRLERQVSDEGAWDCHTNADEGLYVSRNIQWPLLQHRALYLPLA